jgi:hypothetical protein
MHFTRKYKKIEILFILEMNNIYPYNKFFLKHFINNDVHVTRTK